MIVAHMSITHISIRVVMVQRKYDGVAHINNAHTNKSGDIAERAMRWRTYQ